MKEGGGDSELKEVVVDRVEALEGCVVVVSYEAWDLCGRRRGEMEEVAGIVYSACPWDNGGVDFTPLQGIPIDTTEPGMVKDILGTSLHVTETHTAIRVEEGLDEVL